MVEVPACFISGVADWGAYRKPGALERMRISVCENLENVHFVEGAGHWVQQEQSDRFAKTVLSFLRSTDSHQ
ncbi:alpha/beta fold hydrolase [Oryzifoliimicrobium ureilyticus]|uniref:alpha/beta fold hydrolase n=1 Tax=Oryzifoliimicrobium ureilyticus TaxID=3113724 RepID=UPI003076785F